MITKKVKPIDKEDTVNKSTLLNWLQSADKDIPVLELEQWVSAKTNGKYTIVKQEQKAVTLADTLAVTPLTPSGKI